MTARSTRTPPTTPPAMAPTGVDLPFLCAVGDGAEEVADGIARVAALTLGV